MPQIEEQKILYKELSYKLYGLFYRTHNELGRFRSEKSYSDYFENLLSENGLQYSREFRIDPSFRSEALGRNIPDFIVENKIIIDIKAKQIITKEDYFQMRRYLTASKLKLGLLVNFRAPHVYPKRVAN